ncbi:hypothetical protein [Streptomyces niveiscabiei]|uniref:LysR substrate-binding domain-containing protein n=1 Tax=Streptomyces niveiscabiei TaxID=164115 RepID=A0ABW9HN24_9ACTN
MRCSVRCPGSRELRKSSSAAPGWRVPEGIAVVPVLGEPLSLFVGPAHPFAASATVGTFLSERTPLVWPAGHDLRPVPLRAPAPVYPHSLVWEAGNPHPGLGVLREYLAAVRVAPAGGLWVPGWARRPGMGS